MTVRAKTDFSKLPVRYEDLSLRLWFPRRIDDLVTYRNAWSAIEPFMGREGELSPGQEEYLDTVSILLEDYDREHFKQPKHPSADATLRHLVEEHGIKGVQLAKILGVDASMGGKLLRGERHLTVEHIRKLSKYFSLSPAVFFPVT